DCPDPAGCIIERSLVERRLCLLDDVADLTTQPGRIGNSLPHLRVRSLALHALIHDGDLETSRGFPRHKAELRELRIWIFHHAQAHRGVTPCTAKGPNTEPRPGRSAKIPWQQAAARGLKAK